MKKIDIQIVKDIDTTTVYQKLSHPECGGVCVFIGAVRDNTQNEKVEALAFEAYEKMALLEMYKIAEDACLKWDLKKVILHHVQGRKQVEDPVVLVGAASAHRDACFEACRYLIDTLKERVPIWKKEFFSDKTVWVSAHP